MRVLLSIIAFLCFSISMSAQEVGKFTRDGETFLYPYSSILKLYELRSGKSQLIAKDNQFRGLLDDEFDSLIVDAKYNLLAFTPDGSTVRVATSPNNIKVVGPYRDTQAYIVMREPEEARYLVEESIDQIDSVLNAFQIMTGSADNTTTSSQTDSTFQFDIVNDPNSPHIFNTDGKYIDYDDASGSFSAGVETGFSRTESTYLGYRAGSGDTALYQTAIGYRAGQGKGGQGQTAVGVDAGMDNDEGEQTAIGYKAGQSNSGYAQTALGYTAARNNSGDHTIAIGNFTLNDNSGDNVTGVGYKSLAQNTANNTTAVGYQSGLRSTGANNSYFGYEVGDSVSHSDVHLFGYNIVSDQANQVKLGSSTTQLFTIGNLDWKVNGTPSDGDINLYNSTDSEFQLYSLTNNYYDKNEVDSVVSNSVGLVDSVIVNEIDSSNKEIATYFKDGTVDRDTFTDYFGSGSGGGLDSLSNDQLLFADINGEVEQSPNLLYDGNIHLDSGNVDLQSGYGLTVESTNLISATRGGGAAGEYRNIFIGEGADTLADDMIAIGYNALGDIGSRDKNVAIGSNALSNSSAIGGGANNVAIGYNAGSELGTSSANNVFIGRSAGFNVDGGSNIGIGTDVLLGETTSSSIAIGYKAGETGSDRDYYQVYGNQIDPDTSNQVKFDNNFLNGRIRKLTVGNVDWGTFKTPSHRDFYLYDTTWSKLTLTNFDNEVTSISYTKSETDSIVAANSSNGGTTEPMSMLYNPDEQGDYHLVDYNEIDTPTIHPEWATDPRGSSYTYRGEHFRTYFAWSDTNDLTMWLSYFDHNTKTYGEPVNWGKPQTGAQDPHARPNVMVAPDGHIILAYEKLGGDNEINHNSPIHVRKSTYIEDITEWEDTKYSPISNETTYSNMAKYDSTILMVFRYGAASTEHDHGGIIRSFDSGETWYDINGQLMNGSDREPGPFIVDLQANNHWVYPHLQEVPGGFAYILHEHDNSDGSFPNSFLMFSKDGDTWHNWVSWVNDGSSGHQHTLSDSGALLPADIDSNYIIGGDGGYTNANNNRFFNFTIVDDHLILVREDAFKNSGNHIANDYIFTIYDKDGNKTEHSFKENAGIPDSEIEKYYHPLILPLGKDKFDVFIANTGRGYIERWRTQDRGNNFSLIEELNKIDTGYLSSNNTTRYSWRQNPHKHGVFSLITSNLGLNSVGSYQIGLGVNIYQWKDDHFVSHRRNNRRGQWGSYNFDFKTGRSFTIPELGENTSVTIENVPNGEKGIVTVTQTLDEPVDYLVNFDFYADERKTKLEEVIFGANDGIDTTSGTITRVLYERSNNSIFLEYLYPTTNSPTTLSSVNTDKPDPLNQSSVILKGEVVDSGGVSVTETGIVYNVTGDPDTSHTRLVIGSGIGRYGDTVVSGLDTNEIYYVRAYAINSHGITYGNEKTFILPTAPTSPNQIANLRLWLDGADVDGDGTQEGFNEDTGGLPPTDWVDKVNQDTFSAVGSPSANQVENLLFSIECGNGDYFIADKDSSHWDWLHHNDITVVVKMSLLDQSSEAIHSIMGTGPVSPDTVGFHMYWRGHTFNNYLGDIAAFNYTGTGQTFIGIIRETSSYWASNNEFENMVMVMDHDPIPLENEDRVQVYIDRDKTAFNDDNTGTDQSPNRVDPAYPLAFFASPNGSRFLEGNIAEVLIYDRQLQEDEIEQVFDYLENKWP